jgi:hypothetical protein
MLYPIFSVSISKLSHMLYLILIVSISKLSHIIRKPLPSRPNPAPARTLSPASAGESAALSQRPASLAAPSAGGGVRVGGWANVQKRRIGGGARLPGVSLSFL